MYVNNRTAGKNAQTWEIVKAAQSCLLCEWGVWSVVWIKNDSETCVSILHIRALGQGTRYSNVTSSFLPRPKLFAEATITCRLVMPQLNAVSKWSPSQILFSHRWISSIILKPTLHIFLQSAHLNWYMQHHYLMQVQPLLSEEIY